MKRIAVLLCIVFSVLFMHFRCRKDFSPLHLTKNPRELSWSVDTLCHPANWQSLLLDIWASSSEDVYIAGTSNSGKGILWHYNGNQWKDIDIRSKLSGSIDGAISFKDIYGFGPYDVWLVGDITKSNRNPPPRLLFSSLVVHYNGSVWERIPTPEGHILNVVWGPSPEDIWFGGVNGTIFHYNGTAVEKDTIPLNIPKDANPYYVVRSITGNSLEMYMILADYNSKPDRYFFLQHLNGKWVVQDSISSYIYSSKLWMSPSSTLYSIGQSVHIYMDHGWRTILEGFNTMHSNGIHGPDDNHLFVVGVSNTGDFPGVVYHYNGSDWFSYKNLEIQGYIYGEVWTDGEEVFVTGVTGSTTIVLHGK